MKKCKECGCRLDHRNVYGFCFTHRKNHYKGTHGLSKTRQWHCWMNIKSRCLNEKSMFYKSYGGRGIKVCDRWKESFENFWEDMQDGYSDDLTIDRIDNDGNYCKENCRWATTKEQSLNKRDSIKIEYRGEVLGLKAWSSRLNINYNTLYNRLYSYGLSVEDSFIVDFKKRDGGAFKPVVKIDRNTLKVVQGYESLSSACVDNNLSPPSLSNCLAKRTRTAGGFIWEYARGEFLEKIIL